MSIFEGVVVGESGMVSGQVQRARLQNGPRITDQKVLYKTGSLGQISTKQTRCFVLLPWNSVHCILWPLTAVGTHLRIKGQNFNFILKLTLNKICFTWLLNLVRNLVHHIGVWMVLNCPYTHLCRWAKFSSYPEKHSTLSKVCFTQLQNLARHQKCTNFLARFRSCVE